MELFRSPAVLIWTAAAFAAIIPFVAWTGKRRQALITAVGKISVLSALLPAEAADRRRIKLYLLLAGIFLIFVSWAGPQWGVELVPGEAMSGQLVIAVDTSLSMTVQDIKPSRMENAKMMLSMLIDQLSGYRMGVVAFSGTAHIQCPLTTDTEALKFFLSAVSAGMLPEPGTAIGDSIRTAAKMLARYPGRKGLILLTDGEDHHSDPLSAAKEAAAAGISIFAIGLGKPEGDVIPLLGPSGAVSDYKKDKHGRTVVSRLGETDLMQLAAVTGGAYIRYSGPEAAVSEIAKLVRDMEKAKWKGRTRAGYKNRFQIPLLIAWLLLLVEFVMTERRGAGAELARRFRLKLSIK